MLSKLTIAGLNEFTEGHIWDEMELPEGYDRDVVISEIIRQCSEFSVIYTEPIFLAHMIGTWSTKWYHNFDRWLKAYNFEYNALYNLEVEATYTENGSSNINQNGGVNSEGHDIESKAAYDSEAFKNAIKDDHSNHVNTSSSTNGTTNNVKTEKRFGNQGTTMSQTMLEAEYDIWKTNIYQMVAEVFATEMCICIYD